MRAPSVLDEVERLPAAEREAAFGDGNRLRRARERGLQVRRHVVRALVVVFVLGALGRETVEPPREIALHGRVVVLLHEQTGGRVPAEDDGESRRDAARADDLRDAVRDVDERARRRGDFDARLVLLHVRRS